MARLKGILVVLLILASGLSIGALAGYRMALHSEWEESAPPVNVTVTFHWPAAAERSADSVNVTVQGTNATAFGATVAATDALGIELVSRHYQGMGEYVIRLGEYGAEQYCGWLYAVGVPEAAQDADQAADRTRVDDGDHVSWRWDCV